MPVKIRLQRQGKKGKPYFHIVVADARASRDGKYIERLGMYNPNTNPATIEVDVDGAVQWLGNGAVPTDTARAILSYKGVLYKNHLLKGVKKGALTEDEAKNRFEAWLEEKQGKIETKKGSLSSAEEKDRKERLAAEKEVNKKREAAIAAANAPEPVEAETAPEENQDDAGETAEAAVETKTEDSTEDAKVEETKTEEPVATEEKSESTEKPEEKAAEESKAEAKPEEAKATEPVEEKAEEVKASDDVSSEESPEVVKAEKEKQEAIQKEKEEKKD